MKAAPPYAPQIYGNFHTFPRPIAHPADTRMNPSLEANFSLSPLLLSLLIQSSFADVCKNGTCLLLLYIIRIIRLALCVDFQNLIRPLSVSNIYFKPLHYVFSISADTYPVIVTYITAFVCLNFYSIKQIFFRI